MSVNRNVTVPLGSAFMATTLPLLDIGRHHAPLARPSRRTPVRVSHYRSGPRARYTMRVPRVDWHRKLRNASRGISALECPSFEQRLKALPPETLKGLRRGIEKESLRVRPDGALATTPHPVRLGSALTHPHITTDFSESQLELITGVHANAGRLPRGTDRDSPGRLPRDRRRTALVREHALRPAGGQRHSARPVRHVQRRPRQDASTAPACRIAMAGACRPFPASTTTSRCRNRSRTSVLRADPQFPAPFVAAALPVRCLARGVLEFRRRPPARAPALGRRHALPAVRDVAAHGSPGLPERRAIVAQGQLQQSRKLRGVAAGRADAALSSVRGHRHPRRRGLPPARHQPAADRERILRHHPPEARDPPGRAPAARAARARRRIRRSTPAWTSTRSARSASPRTRCAFSTSTCCNCLLRDSPPDTPEELAAVVRNKQRVAERGREPGLAPQRLAGGHAVEWGGEMLAECAPIAAALDAANGDGAHRDALASAVAALNDPATTPSARVLDAMARDYGNSYVRFVLAQSIAHRETILELPLPPTSSKRFAHGRKSRSPSNAKSKPPTRCRSRLSAKTTCPRPA